MFTWNVEELKLRNEVGNNHLYDRDFIFKIENEISKEDKIEFINNMYDGKLDYILELFHKFTIDKKSMPKDDWGKVKTVSLKAWIKRNDKKYNNRIIDDWYNYGKITFVGCERWIQHDDFESKATLYDTHNDYIDEIFHRILFNCLRKENDYFEQHDEYEVLKEKFRNKNGRYHTTFGLHIAVWSSGRICIVKEDVERDITIDELKWIICQYDKLDELVESITSEACNHITF